MSQPHIFIIHHSEIALKKGNRRFFEQRLFDNIKKVLADLKGVDLTMDFGRFLLRIPQDYSAQLILSRLQKVPGTSVIRHAFVGDPDPYKLREEIFAKVKDLEFTTFKVDTRRADKQFPFTSVQVNQIVGEIVFENMHKRVNLKNADLVILVEIYNGKVFYSVEAAPGTRGLPVGSTGKVVTMLSSGIDSPVASYMMMCRGSSNVFIHFHSFPFTEKTSFYNSLAIAKKLNEHQCYARFYSVPLAKLQRAIIMYAPTKLRVVMYRRMMFRLAERIAKREGAKGIVTGESLGQVASQTLENITAIQQVVTMPILRPLIGMDKEEIVSRARSIGTYEMSIEPYDDCCSYLVPKRPETMAKMDEVFAAEEKIVGWQELIEEALRESEIEKLTFPEKS